MSDWLVIGITVVAVVAALPYVLGPALVLVTMRYDPSAPLLPTVPDAMPVPAAEFLQQQTDVLGELGFRDPAWLALDGLVGNVSTRMVVACSPTERTLAMAAVMVGQVEGARPVRAHHVEFATDWSDGHEACTNNSSELVPPPITRHKCVLQLPDEIDTVRLAEAHRALVSRESAGRTLLRTPAPADLVDRVSDGMRTEFECLAASGYIRLTSTGQYRPTLKGAVLMTWGLLWPFSAVRRVRRRSRAAATLRELGVG